MRTAVLALFVILHFTLVTSAEATTTLDICDANADPCVVKIVKNGVPVTSGSLLDFGARTLRVPPGAQLVVPGTGGNMTITAGAVDVQATGQGAGQLRAVGGRITVTATTGDINLRRLGGSIARIDASGDPASGGGGTIELEAVDGNVLIDGELHAEANAADGSGGFIALKGASVVLGSSGKALLYGKRAGGGGALAIDSGSNLTLGGTIDGSGGEFGGGEVDLGAAGNVVSLATIDLQATAGGGDGGILEIYGDSAQIEPVGGSVTLGGPVNLSGDSGTDFGGSGGLLDIGDLVVPVRGSVTINAPINASSGNGGDGGDVTVVAELDIAQNAAVLVQGKGTEGLGGNAIFEAHHGLTFADVDASGDVLSGGEIDGTAWCSVTVPQGRLLDSSDGGSIVLQSGGSLSVAGRLKATNGSNELDYLTTLPVVTGIVDPPTVPMQDSTLTPCGGGPPTCGNGTLDPGETCDGPLGTCPAGQTCTACACAAPPSCGDDVVQPGELCDDGNQTDGDGCDSNCKPTACGNGRQTTGEECDDGNMTAGDGCSPSCKMEACGNNELDPGEECDDGSSGSATCTSDCHLMSPATCGNGVVDAGETCDDGNRSDCDGCSRFCLSECGDGNTTCGEQCDDSNTAPNDGCSSTCKTEFCGDHLVQTDEECDDGTQNGTPGDPCSGTCTLHWCGDGVVDEGEQCDDANLNECDLCKPDCTPVTASCPICTAGATGPCIPCRDTLDCDPLNRCGASACTGGTCTPVSPPNCDDQNGCTVDSCDPAVGCTHAPVVCQDSSACNGVESCSPATGGCVSGPAPDCNDSDDCTDDSCTETAPTATCRHDVRAGLAGATCRIGQLTDLVASAGDIPKGTRKKLQSQLRKIAKKLPAATGTGKKAARAMKQINNGLKALRRTVAKAQRKLSPDTMSKLNTAIQNTSTAIGGL